MIGAAGGGRVLVAGAINTDLVARARVAPGPGETVTGRDFRIFGGGKGANQALAAARSGAATAMLGALGEDDFGRARLADLRADQVEVGHIAMRPDAASGVALITVEESGQNRILYVPGATARIEPEQARAAVRGFRPDVILTTLEPPLNALEALLAAGREHGATVVLSATPEPESGRALVPRVDVLIVNETEAAGLLGLPPGDHDWATIAARLGELGPDTVVITLGGAGALVRCVGEAVTIPAPAVTVVDTTGAGDALAGALAARLAEGADPITAVRIGVLAGSLAVTVAGAQPSMPTRAAIDEFGEGVRR